MRGIVLWAALSVLPVAPPQSQAPSSPTGASGWTETATSATSVKAGIAFPLSAGSLKKTELRQYDKDGADLSARYVSVDQAIQGTIFLSAPTLPDTGLAFLANDEEIRRPWGPATHVVADQLIPVGSVKAAQRRVVYQGAKAGQTPLVIMVAMVRAGSWMVVGQVTGPADRANEIGKDLDAFIAGMAFPKGSEPLPVKVIKTEPCEPPDRSIAARGTRPTQADAGEFVLASQSSVVDYQDDALHRTPDRLCRESIELDGPVALQIYRPLGTSDRPFLPRLYALFGNSGVILEIAESRKEPGAFYILRHGVGRMYAFGKFDRAPSVPQIRALVVAPEKQPAFATYDTRSITANGSDQFTIICARTVEGCPGDESEKPKP